MTGLLDPITEIALFIGAMSGITLLLLVAAFAGGTSRRLSRRLQEVSIQVAKPPVAWKGIPYVESLNVDLDRLKTEHVLFEGSAREGVPHFPQNVNIAADRNLIDVRFPVQFVLRPHLDFRGLQRRHRAVVRGGVPAQPGRRFDA